MKKYLVFLALAAAACASSDKQGTHKVQVDLQQLTVMSSTQPTGPIDIDYAIVVNNTSDAAVTIKRVQIQQIGSGSYQISQMNPPSFNVSQTIQPGATDSVKVTLHAYLLAAPVNVMGGQPVNLRATVDFDAPGGAFHEMVHKVITQFP